MTLFQMDVRLVRFGLVLLGVSVGLLTTTGCGGKKHGEIHLANTRLKPLMIIYGRYQAQNRGRTPASEGALKKFASKEANQAFLDQFELNSPDEMFVSRRDEKPFVIAYGGVETSRPGGPWGDDPVVAYEQEGVRGKRFVAGSLGQVEEVDDETFRKLVPDAN